MTECTGHMGNTLGRKVWRANTWVKRNQWPTRSLSARTGNYSPPALPSRPTRRSYNYSCGSGGSSGSVEHHCCQITRTSLCSTLRRKCHSAEESLEARLGTERIEECLRSNVDEGIVVFLKRSLEQWDGTIFVAEASVNNSE